MIRFLRWRGAWMAALVALLTCAIECVWAREPPSSVPAVLETEPAPQWEAKFAGGKGWIGGDGVYSAVLGSRRVLWLFGDTMLGEVKGGRRDGAVLVNNTLAIQNGRGADAALHFETGHSKEGKAAAFFTPADGKGWFWPHAAVRVEGRLFVFLTQIGKTKDAGVFGFRQIGEWLAVVDNPEEEPKAWRVKQLKLPFTSFEKDHLRWWGSAVLQADGQLYIYGCEERGKRMDRRRLTVARVPLKMIDDFTAWRFRTADGWSSQATDAAPLAAGLATEFSVSPMPGRKDYVAVYTENGLGARILARFAPAPQGPWSAPLLLYKCPEMAKHKGLFSYAGKAHPWAAEANELLVSYCVNTSEFARLFREEKLYRPKFVRVKLKFSREP